MLLQNDKLHFTYTNTSITCRGDVVTLECVEKVIKKDMMHPLTGTKLTEKDIIPLERVIKLNVFFLSIHVVKTFFGLQGGTGFASVNESLEGKEARPVMQA